MADLRRRLDECLAGRACVVGLGNPIYGDDGLGVRVAERLRDAGQGDAVVGGVSPERIIGVLAAAYDRLLLVDAVDFGGEPGSVVLMSAEESRARFPQVSTHKISLGLLAMLAESYGGARTSVLGVQPQSLRPGDELTPRIRDTVDALCELLASPSLEGATDASTGLEGAALSAPSGEARTYSRTTAALTEQRPPADELPQASRAAARRVAELSA